MKNKQTSVKLDSLGELYDRGDIQGIKSRILQGSEPLLEIAQGPKNKNLYTYGFECFVEYLKTLSPVHFKLYPQTLRAQDVDGKTCLIFQENDLTINVTHWLEKVDFDHISLNKPKSYWESFISSDITSEEKKAIKSYTGSNYSNVNDLLHQEYIFIIKQGSSAVAKLLIDIGNICSGLSKLSTVLFPDATFRSEHFWGSTKSAVLDAKIDAHDERRPFELTAFTSTSKDKLIWGEGDVNIAFLEPYGKNISGLSYYPFEREYLMMPSKIHIMGYKQENNQTFFIARSVNTIDDEISEYSLKELSDFAKMLKLNPNYSDWTTFNSNLEIACKHAFEKNGMNFAHEESSLASDIQYSNEQVESSLHLSEPYHSSFIPTNWDAGVIIL